MDKKERIEYLKGDIMGLTGELACLAEEHSEYAKDLIERLLERHEELVKLEYNG